MAIVRRAAAISLHTAALTGQTIGASLGAVTLAVSAPSWVSDLTLNQWTSLPVFNNHADVQAANTGQYGNSGPNSVLNAWCGGVYIPSYGTKGGIFHCGGGHQDYYGNEVYVFDLALLRWFRLTSPSIQANFAGPFANGILSDGKPNAAVHTYYYLAHRGGKYVLAKRQVDNQPNAVYSITQFDPQTLAWTSSLATPATLNPTNDEGICYDPDRDVVWMVNVNPLEWSRYSFVTDSWTTFTQPTGALQPQCGPVYCEGQQAVIEFVDNAIWGLDPADPTHDKYVISTSGTSPSRGTGDCPRWSNNLGRLIYYPSASNSLYELAPPPGNWRTDPWAWSQRSVTGTTGTHTGNGTYGKFQVISWGSKTVGMVCGNPAQPYRGILLAA